MRPLPVIVAVIVLCASIGVISWMSQPRTSESAETRSTDESPTNPFSIPKEGPYPRAVLEEEEFDFGSMILGETQSHPFVIRNAGDAPLRLQKGFVACKCTVPSVPENDILPGESAEVVMEWTPLEASEAFDKHAVIWTNDPENDELTLKITGAVRHLIRLQPVSPWTIRTVNDGEESTFTGAIGSGLESFNVTQIESTADWLTAEVTPFDPSALNPFGPDCSSGYHISGSVRPEMSVGRFEEKLTIHTDVKDGHTLEIVVVGTRPGPFSILGREWYGSGMSVQMGTFPSTEGKTVTLSLFTDREDEPIAITSQSAEPDIAKVSLKRDEAFPSPAKEKYDIVFSMPAGVPVGRYLDDDRIKLRIQTNRESMSDLILSVDAVVE